MHFGRRLQNDYPVLNPKKTMKRKVNHNHETKFKRIDCVFDRDLEAIDY